MGQKVHPIGIRLGITKEWTSKWYANTQTYPEFVEQDHRVRTFLEKRLKDASVSRVHIERPAKKANITIHTARPGIVIGKKGEDIEKLRGEVAALLRMPLQDVRINIAEIRKPEVDAKLVAEGIAQQLERRVQFRRAMRRAVTNTMRVGAEGIKVKVAGRLNGAEIARSEWYREGRVPLHTLRADIDYGLAEARTTYGVIGVKVWICRGEIYESSDSGDSQEGSKANKPARSASATPAATETAAPAAEAAPAATETAAPAAEAAPAAAETAAPATEAAPAATETDPAATKPATKSE
ncbi:MAG: 30S ribosomal protein S3 [Gammaproteobacteria bacterium]|nr:30S ribosomal protein S3 [Gammaproteobacteria bacterium]